MLPYLFYFFGGANQPSPVYVVFWAETEKDAIQLMIKNFDKVVKDTDARAHLISLSDGRRFAELDPNYEFTEDKCEKEEEDFQRCIGCLADVIKAVANGLEYAH